MPSEQDGILIRNDVLSYSVGKEGFVRNFDELPKVISDLRPLYMQIDGEGVLVVFRNVFVEDYGYYYVKDGVELSDENLIFKSKISDGVYKYFNPG